MLPAAQPGDEAIKHLLVPGMSYVVYKCGTFPPYPPACMQ